MSHVFISYVHENRETVEYICRILRSRGIEVWLDRDKLEPGVFWEEAIRKAIREGKFFIACFSKEYNARSRTQMNEELNVAIEELRKRPRDQAWFIPIKLSECDIPDWYIGAGKTLRSIQWIEFYRDQDAGIQSILDVIQPVHSNVRRVMELGIKELRNIDNPESERLKAIWILEAIALHSGNSNAKARIVSVLIDTLRDRSIPVCRQATAALKSIGTTKCLNAIRRRWPYSRDWNIF